MVFIMMIAVNESKHFEVAGDVTVYADAEALVQKLEIIDVENNEYFAIREDGIRLDLSVLMGSVVVKEANSTSGYENVLRCWLGVLPTEDHLIRMRAVAVHAGELKIVSVIIAYVLPIVVLGAIILMLNR